MAEVDTSIYNELRPQPVNPLDTFGKYQGVANSMLHNKLLQQDVQGRIALGQIIQKNTDPQTGQLNQATAMRDIANDPNAQMFALNSQHDMMAANPLTSYTGTNAQGQPTPKQAPYSQVIGMNNPAQQVPSQDKIDQLHAHNQAMINTLEPLSSDPDLDERKVMDGVVNLVQDPSAQFTASDGASVLSSLPSGQNGNAASPDQLRPVVNQHLQKQKQIEAHLTQNYPSTQQQTAQDGSVGSAVGTPVGYSGAQQPAQEHLNEVRTARDNVPQQQAVLDEVLNLSKGGTPSGTSIAQLEKKMASSGLAPDSIVQEGASMQVMAKYMEQAALAAGMPTSDARLDAIHQANTNPSQLPQAIQALVPFLKASAEGNRARANYYDSTVGNGLDYNKIQDARKNWTNNYSPLWFEYSELPNARAKADFLKKNPQLLGKSDQLSNLHQMGVLGQ